ncbi:MAG: TolC family protein [Deltaproteobacteria bacterium]|nr:TolC family protein [Deltaproteobacteria bacterium]
MHAVWPSLTIIALAGVAHAETPSAGRADKLTFEQVMTKALAGPKVQMAVEDRKLAAARLEEADSARFPRGKLSAFAAPSPRIECLNPECTITNPRNFALRYEGLWGGGQIEIVQPLLTFGKTERIRRAARAGVAAYTALVDEAAGDLAVDAAKAFYGVKLARELTDMLDGGIEQINKAIDAMKAQTGANAPSLQDRQRVSVLLAEARAQRADAASGLAQALAGMRALVGADTADVDDTHLEPIEIEPPASVDARARPQAVAAREGALAADEIVRASRAFYFPDISIVGTAYLAGAQGADDPRSAYAFDPYNRTFVNLYVNLTWNLEPFKGAALRDKVDADARKAHALAKLAAAGAGYDAQTALAELVAAKEKVDAAREGEQAGRAWVASVLQGEAIGIVEAKDLADAYIAYFQMRARWLQAVYQLNVAAVRLRRATGDCRLNRPCA